jgi:hypothetical protein
MIQPQKSYALVGSFHSYESGITVDNIWDSLGWFAGTLKKLTLYFEGTARSHLSVEEIIDPRMFTKLEHMVPGSSRTTERARKTLYRSAKGLP